jgi:hypothetical protein
MVQSSFILSAIAVLGLSHMVIDGVNAAPSFDTAQQLFGRIYRSHFYLANEIEEETTNSTSSCPIEFTNNTLDAVRSHLFSFFFLYSRILTYL